MAKIFVENQPYEVQEGQNLLQACLALGFDLPYFCWHPALGSVGACRQCAVKVFRDERDTRGRIVMACLTPAAEGTRISISDPEAQECRASLIEWLMTNHPHDCPVCDEGGECHLQDMTVMTGHAYREFRFKKRTYQNQDLGPFINHEMNRCIQCYRCVRFYCDYAGGKDLGTFAAHNHVYFGRFEDGALESEFSGNLVEVCPTGVFTDKTLKQHYTRKWDLQTAPSICVHCGLGCNTIAGERYGQLRRILNRYHDAINGYFLCDRGRYGYEFVNSDRRLRHVQVNGQPQPAAAALDQLGKILGGEAKVIGIGSPRASIEANFALQTLVGPGRFYHGVAAQEGRLIASILAILQTGPARSPSLRDVRQADAILVLGEEVTNTAPLLDLALRQAIRQSPMQAVRKLHVSEWDDAAVREIMQDAKGPFFIATATGTKLDELATATYRAAPDDLARLGFAVAQAIDPAAPAVQNLPTEVQALAQQIAQALREAEKPLIVSGTSCGSEAVVQAAANVAWALCQAGRPAELGYAVPEANSLGLGLLGGSSLNAALQAVEEGSADTVVILENDLYRRAERASINALLEKAKHVIVIDHLQTATAGKAEIVLPAATFAEGSGALVSGEGRAQRFYQVFGPEGDIQASWQWVCALMAAAGRPEAERWQNLDDLDAALAEKLPVFRALTEIAPSADFRWVGQRIPRQPVRYSGRTAMHANIDVNEPKPLDDANSPLAFSMEGYRGPTPAALTARYWQPGWNSVQAFKKFQAEIGRPLQGGDSGQRLIEPGRREPPAYFSKVPPAFTPLEAEWLLLPLYHIFGSEETSILTHGIAQRAPSPYLGLNPQDAQQLQVSEGMAIDLTIAGAIYHLRIKVMATLPLGVAGLPAGVAEAPELYQPEPHPLRQEMQKRYE